MRRCFAEAHITRNDGIEHQVPDIDYLYASSGLPFELKHVIQKATAEDPQDRYASVEDLYSHLKRSRAVRRTGTVAIAALALALICVGLFFEMLPNTEPVEFVKPVEEPVEESLLDEGFDPLDRKSVV